MNLEAKLFYLATDAAIVAIYLIRSFPLLLPWDIIVVESVLL